MTKRQTREKNGRVEGGRVKGAFGEHKHALGQKNHKMRVAHRQMKMCDNKFFLPRKSQDARRTSTDSSRPLCAISALQLLARFDVLCAISALCIYWPEELCSPNEDLNLCSPNEGFGRPSKH